MPCNCCEISPYKISPNEDWGPFFWKILHTLAERAGKQRNPLVQADEMRYWKRFIQALPTALPCHTCRDNLNKYLAVTPFSPPTSYVEWDQYVRTWFFSLHNYENTWLKKPLFLFDDLATTYSNPSTLAESIAHIEFLEKNAILAGIITQPAWKRWYNEFVFLRAALT